MPPLGCPFSYIGSNTKPCQNLLKANEAQAKVLAVIEADKRIEAAEKKKEQEKVVEESMKRMETDMTFNFSWG